MSTRRAIIIIASICAAFATFLVYMPTLHNGFVNWDDGPYIYQSQLIQTIDAAFFKAILTSVVYHNWHPLTTLSYALDFQLWGLDPRGYHLTNIVFHSLNTFLLSIVVFLLTEKVLEKSSKELPGYLPLMVGLGTAIMFGLHPVHVESVAWLSERKDVLFVFFYFLSILFYLRYNAYAKKSSYIASLASFALALMSKPMAISLPLALIIIDYYPLERLRAGTIKKTLLEKLPFFVLVTLSAFATIYAQQSAIISLDTAPFTTRVLVAAYAYIFYLYTTLVPVGLAPYYPYPLEVSLFDIKYIGSIAILAGVTLFCLLTARRQKVITAVWAFYLLSLFPVIGIVQVGGQAAADRYLYLPGVGILMLATAGFGVLADRAIRTRGYVITTVATCIVCAFFTTVTAKQITIWKDGVSLWSRQVEIYPDAPIGHLKRSVALKDQGRLFEALTEVTRCIKLSPDYSPAYSNRAGIHYLLNDYDSAINDINMAIRLNPGEQMYYANLKMLKQLAYESRQSTIAASGVESAQTRKAGYTNYGR